MANLAITAAQVEAGENADFLNGTAGEAVTAGQVCYQSARDHLLRLASATGGAAAATVKGVALHDAAARQPLKLQTDGDIIVGAGAAPDEGALYILSATAGAIAEAGDLASGMYTSVIGVGGPNDTITLTLAAPGHQVP
jgi:hypothetical protein